VNYEAGFFKKFITGEARVPGFSKNPEKVPSENPWGGLNP
jgi:hypothetical protein